MSISVIAFLIASIASRRRPAPMSIGPSFSRGAAAVIFLRGAGLRGPSLGGLVFGIQNTDNEIRCCTCEDALHTVARVPEAVWSAARSAAEMWHRAQWPSPSARL